MYPLLQKTPSYLLLYGTMLTFGEVVMACHRLAPASEGDMNNFLHGDLVRQDGVPHAVVLQELPLPILGPLYGLGAAR